MIELLAFACVWNVTNLHQVTAVHAIQRRIPTDPRETSTYFSLVELLSNAE